MAAKAKVNPNSDRLKINVGWEEAARRMLATPAGSTPPRKAKPRKRSKRQK